MTSTWFVVLMGGLAARWLSGGWRRRVGGDPFTMVTGAWRQDRERSARTVTSGGQAGVLSGRVDVGVIGISFGTVMVLLGVWQARYLRDYRSTRKTRPLTPGEQGHFNIIRIYPYLIIPAGMLAMVYGLFLE